MTLIERDRLEDSLYNMIFVKKESFELDYNIGINLYVFDSSNKMVLVLKKHFFKQRIIELLNLYFSSYIDVKNFEISVSNEVQGVLNIILKFPILNSKDILELGVDV